MGVKCPEEYVDAHTVAQGYQLHLSDKVSNAAIASFRPHFKRKRDEVGDGIIREVRQKLSQWRNESQHLCMA